MRFITRLATETQQLLNTIEQKSKYYQVRNRAKSILLSYQGYNISQIMLIFNVSRNTVYNWFNNWEADGLNGLYNLRLNVLGFMKTNNELESYIFESSINSDVVIGCIDNLSEKIRKETVLMMDNASIHQNIQLILPRYL